MKTVVIVILVVLLVYTSLRLWATNHAFKVFVKYIKENYSEEIDMERMGTIAKEHTDKIFGNRSKEQQ